MPVLSEDFVRNNDAGHGSDDAHWLLSSSACEDAAQ